MRRFLRGFLIFAIGGLLGAGAGFGAGIWFFPYLFPPPVGTDVMTQEEKAKPTFATGTFIHADPSDRVHWGRGNVTVQKDQVYLEPNFEVGPGPDYRVLLVKKANIKTKAEVVEAIRNKQFVEISGLRSFKGGQRYAVPAGVNVEEYQSVVIWCWAFSQLISPATLERK
ncbi:MAG: DM13 domain-containing protein [Xanthobacteraceae bacterium]|nr:DM13 domain-containing protein [Xanthobacteraceae bacterium]QYK44449.1 MAG: DM13 domain-containing protein [Xanthobacteraceae bacterium]HMN51093.1 DM13 domain-containing protein [Xanthobacteraceae bacterium]